MAKFKFKKDGLESKVFKLDKKMFIYEEKQRFIPYCDFRWHKGIVLDIDVCEKRKCKYYHKLEISPENKKYY